MTNSKGSKTTLKELLTIFLIFFKIGLFTIGGGLIMIPIMHSEFVEKRKWVDKEKIMDIFSVAQALPGVIALNSSIYIGYSIKGVLGAVIAAIGITLPSAICILAIYYAFLNAGGEASLYAAKFYQGIRAAVIALIGITVIRLAKSSIKDLFGAFTALLGIALTVFLKLDIPYVILTCGFLGYMYYSVIISKIKKSSGRANDS